MIDEKSKKIIEEFVRKNVLVSPDAIEKLKDLDKGLIDELLRQNIAVIDSDIIELFKSNKRINIEEFEKAKTIHQKFGEEKVYNSFFEKNGHEDKTKEINGYKIKVIKNYFENANKKTTENFVNYYLNRYKFLSSILENNIGLKELTTIRKVKEKKDSSEVSIIGMVYDKIITKTNKIQLVLEDQTGLINVFVTESDKELYEEAKDIVTDEVIGVLGNMRGNVFFAKQIFLPEIPILNEKLKSEDEVYAVFLSDFHIGSNKFMPEEINKFLSWINSDLGDENQRRIAGLTKYVFVMGDLVDGVGIYPGQEKELTIKDIYKQYDAFVSFILKIPKDKHIIIIPGNHDAVRISEPQPPIPKKFIPKLYETENITLLSNPSTINIHCSGNFPGFDVLLYHGFSFDYYVANVNSIRLKGGYDRADLVIKFLLQRRHLAPSYTSTIFSPEYDEDPLVISRVPQIIATGHIHKCSISDYRGTTLISGSCWQLKTTFQEKMGHHPEPGRVPLVNLKTRDYKILKFI